MIALKKIKWSLVKIVNRFTHKASGSQTVRQFRYWSWFLWMLLAPRASAAAAAGFRLDNHEFLWGCPSTSEPLIEPELRSRDERDTRWWCVRVCLCNYAVCLLSLYMKDGVHRLTHGSNSKNTCTHHIKSDRVRYTYQMTAVASHRDTQLPGRKNQQNYFKMISALTEKKHHLYLKKCFMW